MTNKHKRRRNNRPAQKRMRRLCILYMNMNLAIPTIVGAPSSSSSAATAAGDEINQHAHHSNLRHGPLHIQAAENGGFAPGFVRRILRGHGNGIGDGSDAGGANGPLLRIGDGFDDSENHERRQLQEGPEWYVNWFESKCVQNCRPTKSKPHCGGYARWDQPTFRTGDECCQTILNWMPLQDCEAVLKMNALNGSSGQQQDELDGGEAGGDGRDNGDGGTEEAWDGSSKCPPEYANYQTYRPADSVTIPINDELGHVYTCKTGPLSQYCNLFAPDWARGSDPGAVHTMGDVLGWEMVGSCDAGFVNLLAEAMGDVLGDVLDGFDNFGLDGDGENGDGGLEDGALSLNGLGMSPSAAKSPSTNFDKPTGGRPSNGGDGLEDGAFSLNGLGMSPSAAKSPSTNFDKPTGGRPSNGRPTKPLNRPNSNRPPRPIKPELQDGDTADSTTPWGSITFGTGNSPAGGSPGSYGDTSGSGTGNGAFGNGLSSPANSIRPSKPDDNVLVQKLEDTNGDEEEDDQVDLVEGDDGMWCWRSGRSCDSDAGKFACCTMCVQGICI